MWTSGKCVKSRLASLSHGGNGKESYCSVLKWHGQIQCWWRGRIPDTILKRQQVSKSLLWTRQDLLKVGTISLENYHVRPFSKPLAHLPTFFPFVSSCLLPSLLHSVLPQPIHLLARPRWNPTFPLTTLTKCPCPPSPGLYAGYICVLCVAVTMFCLVAYLLLPVSMSSLFTSLSCLPKFSPPERTWQGC